MEVIAEAFDLRNPVHCLIQIYPHALLVASSALSVCLGPLKQQVCGVHKVACALSNFEHLYH